MAHRLVGEEDDVPGAAVLLQHVPAGFPLCRRPDTLHLHRVTVSWSAAVTTSCTHQSFFMLLTYWNYVTSCVPFLAA